MTDLFLNMYLQPLVELPDIAKLLTLMGSFRSLTIARFDDVEPLRRKFDPSQLMKMADAFARCPTAYWRSANRRTEGSLRLSAGMGSQTCSIAVAANADDVDPPSELREFCLSASRQFGPTYGFIHLLTSSELQDEHKSPAIFFGRPPGVHVTRRNLVVSVPDIFWGNVFGPPYVRLFGREKLRSLPAGIAHEIAEDTYYLQLSEDVRDLRSNYREIREMRDQVKRHLGPDAFFDFHLQLKKRYEVPALGWKEPRQTMTGIELINMQRAAGGLPPLQLLECGWWGEPKETGTSGDAE